MAGYNYGGFTAPASITSKEQVRAMQRELGVTADGLWGPKTDAAYRAKYGDAQSRAMTGSPYETPYAPDYARAMQDAQALYDSLNPEKPSYLAYNGPSRREIEAGLRPVYDVATSRRKAQTAANQAALASNATARGMGRSVWLDDVNQREFAQESSDIAALEAGYAEQLLAALHNEEEQKRGVEQYNAQLKANADALRGQFVQKLASGFYSEQRAKEREEEKERRR